MDAKPDPEPAESPAPWWKCIVAALPDLFLALQFAMAAVTGKAFHATPEWLTAVMQTELIVIHSMGAFGALLFYRPASALRRFGRAAAIVALLLFYLVTAYIWGFDHVAVFVSAAFATYLGLFLSWGSPSALDQLGMRWIVCMVVYWVAINVFGLPDKIGEWAGLRSVLWAGALYFLALGAIELSGFYMRTVPRRAHRIHMSLRRG